MYKIVDGKAVEIEYTVIEIGVDENNQITMIPGDAESVYTVKIEGNKTDGFTITNSHETTEVTVILTKTWKDEADDSARLDAAGFAGILTLRGYTDQEMPEPKAVDNEDDTYTVTWTNLPKYEPNKVGTVINYGVSEDATKIPLYRAGTVEKDAETTDATNNVIGFKVENERKVAQVYLGKQVTGNMGERERVFEFTVTVKGADGETVITIDGVTTEDANITRKHGNASLLGTFPVGAIVTIQEKAVEKYDTTSGYNEQASVTNAEKGTTTSEVTFTVAETGNTVTFYNDRHIQIDTGVPTESKPYLLLLGLIPLAGAALVLGSRRRRRKLGV